MVVGLRERWPDETRLLKDSGHVQHSSPVQARSVGCVGCQKQEMPKVESFCRPIGATERGRDLNAISEAMMRLLLRPRLRECAVSAL